MRLTSPILFWGRMKINIGTDKRVPFRKLLGGYSGVGIKPIVMRMVYEAASVLRIPILATGGVSPSRGRDRIFNGWRYAGGSGDS